LLIDYYNFIYLFILGDNNGYKLLKPGENGTYIEKDSGMKLRDYWIFFAKTVTCCICPICLTKCGMPSKPVQMAWREKVKKKKKKKKKKLFNFFNIILIFISQDILY